jgi:hypothetical protein
MLWFGGVTLELVEKENVSDVGVTIPDVVVVPPDPTTKLTGIVWVTAFPLVGVRVTYR